MENNIKSELKNTFTTYWHYLALQKACQFNIFDWIEKGENTLHLIANAEALNQNALTHLLDFLVESAYLDKKGVYYELTPKGAFLTENHHESLKETCLLWGQEHLAAWQNLDYTLQTGKPSFNHLYQASFFDYLDTRPQKLKNYHLGIVAYAHDDYKNLPTLCDFSKYKTIADVGGGVGVLINLVAQHYPKTHCVLFDLPQVTALIPNQESLSYEVKSGNFFEPLSFKTDAIILSRVLHDWNDEKALHILKNCKAALNKGGDLYILEILQNEVQTPLLNLNLLLTCESYERTLQEYQLFLTKVSLTIKTIQPLNDLQQILICHAL